MFRILTFCLTALFGAAAFMPAAPARAEEQASHKMQEVRVTASPADAAGEAGGISELSQRELDLPFISGSLLEPLASLAGLQVTGATGFGQVGGLRLRGFDQTRYQVLWDGLPVQRDGSYGNGPMDWSIFPPGEIQGVKIYRGGLPAKYGNSLGGLVAITGLAPDQEPHASLTGMYGSLDTWSLGATHRWKAGPLGWSLAARQYETDGYLRNNYLDNFNFNGKLTLDLPWGLQVGAGVTHSQGTTGLAVYNRPDSPYYDPDRPDADELELGGPALGSRLINGVYAWGDGSELDSRNTLYHAYLKGSFPKGSFVIKGMVWNQETTEYYYDAADSSRRIYQRESTPEDNNWQLSADFTFIMGDHTLEVGGLTRSYGWGDQTVPYMDSSYFNASISYFQFVSQGFLGQPDCLQYHALYAQDTWKLTPDLELEAGLRGEIFRADEIDPAAFGFPASAAVTSLSRENLAPRLALRWRPWKDGLVSLRLGLAHRYPNSPEYFWWYLNRGSGFFNTDLEPERAVQFDLGLEQRVGDRLTLAARAYYYDISDYLSSTTVSGVGTVVYNIDQVQMLGGELEARLTLPWRLALWGNLTLQQADKDGDPWDQDNQATNQLPNFPSVMANLGLEYQPLENLRADLSLQYTGPRDYLKNRAVQELGSIFLLNLNASYRFLETEWGSWEALVNLHNLLDRDYELLAGYPMAGFTAMGGLRYRF